MFDYVIREDKINNFDINNFNKLIGKCHKVFNELSSLEKEITDALGENSSIMGCFELAVNDEEIKYELSAIRDAFKNTESLLKRDCGVDYLTLQLAKKFAKAKGVAVE